MMKPTISTKEHTIGHACMYHWQEVTPGERFIIRTPSGDTNGLYSMLEVIADPRNGVPIHVHENEDEHFIVLEGTAHIAIGDKRSDVEVGSSITVPKGIPHAWCNRSNTPLRMLVLFSPGGIDELFRENAGRDNVDVMALADKFGTRMIGPALFDDIYTILSPRPKVAGNV
jgi:mannose-6-phosphate isomerase-like protein (cupin superfamily)